MADCVEERRLKCSEFKDNDSCDGEKSKTISQTITHVVASIQNETFASIQNETFASMQNEPFNQQLELNFLMLNSPQITSCASLPCMASLKKNNCRVLFLNT